ncbi:MAG TPA: GAP family protein [Mycobacterium sp.]|nr:GAP family protein [Mycobacterium sp.]
MWITLMVMAVAVSLEPFRIGMTVLMLNRPRPTLQLLAFLSGGFAMGTAVGLVVLFVFRHRLSGATHFTLPKVQIVIGVLAVLVATAVVATPSPPRGMETLFTRARHLLDGSSPWVAGAAGLGIALPSLDYLAVLAVILASGAAPATQVGALLTFNVVAFTLVEIPLVAYLAAPDKTRALMAALHNWIRSHRRRNVAVVLAVVGSVLLAVGIAGL